MGVCACLLAALRLPPGECPPSPPASARLRRPAACASTAEASPASRPLHLPACSHQAWRPDSAARGQLPLACPACQQPSALTALHPPPAGHQPGRAQGGAQGRLGRCGGLCALLWPLPRRHHARQPEGRLQVRGRRSPLRAAGPGRTQAAWGGWQAGSGPHTPPAVSNDRLLSPQPLPVQPHRPSHPPTQANLSALFLSSPLQPLPLWPHRRNVCGRARPHRGAQALCAGPRRLGAGLHHARPGEGARVGGGTRDHPHNQTGQERALRPRRRPLCCRPPRRLPPRRASPFRNAQRTVHLTDDGTNVLTACTPGQCAHCVPTHCLPMRAAHRVPDRRRHQRRLLQVRGRPPRRPVQGCAACDARAQPVRAGPTLASHAAAQLRRRRATALPRRSPAACLPACPCPPTQTAPATPPFKAQAACTLRR